MTSPLQQVADDLASHIGEMRVVMDELFSVVKDVAQMQMIDAEDIGDRIAYRFAMPGKQLFNPPRFVVAARSALSAYERVRKLYSIETGVTEVRKQAGDVS